VEPPPGTGARRESVSFFSVSGSGALGTGGALAFEVSDVALDQLHEGNQGNVDFDHYVADDQGAESGARNNARLSNGRQAAAPAGSQHRQRRRCRGIPARSTSRIGAIGQRQWPLASRPREIRRAFAAKGEGSRHRYRSHEGGPGVGRAAPDRGVGTQTKFAKLANFPRRGGGLDLAIAASGSFSGAAS
jgi:hypothetical protein